MNKQRFYFYIYLGMLFLLVERAICLAFYLQRLDLIFADVENVPVKIWETVNGNALLAHLERLSLQCAGLASLCLFLAPFCFPSKSHGA